jgi:hypothetical protein
VSFVPFTKYYSDEMGKACDMQGEAKNSYKVLGDKLYKKKLGIHRHRWDDNNKVDLKVTRLEDMDWIHLVYDKDNWQGCASMVMNLQVL